MSKFVLVYSGGKMPESEAEQKAVVKEWETWYGKLGAAVVDPGNPFTPQVKTIAGDGKVRDGAPGKAASGYTILQADSQSAAVEMAKGCPVGKSGGEISVYETFDVM